MNPGGGNLDVSCFRPIIIAKHKKQETDQFVCTGAVCDGLTVPGIYPVAKHINRHDTKTKPFEYLLFFL